MPIDRRWRVVVVGLTLMACAAPPGLPGADPFPVPGPRGGAVERARGGDVSTRRSRPVLARKRVSDKTPPARLEAADGTSCLVSEERFRKVAVGDAVWCGWAALD